MSDGHTRDGHTSDGHTSNGHTGNVKMSRRAFLAVSSAGGAGLLIGFNLWGCKDHHAAPEPATPSAAATEATTTTTTAAPERAEFNAWLRIGTDDTVTVTVSESEMGQGVLTSLPMIIADELDADWSKVRAELAGADERFGRQSTGGSSSIRRDYDPMRRVGATARAMLIAAAAREWKVPPGQCRARSGEVIHAKSGRRARFGQLAEQAAAMPVPAHPPLKPPGMRTLIGQPLRRLDTPPKARGTAIYGIDVKVPGMLIAQVAHCPVFGGKLAHADDRKAKAVPGVRAVVTIPTGVAVVADHFWAAKKGREALALEWNEGPGAKLDSASISATLRKIAGHGATAANRGDVAKAMARAAHKLEAVYEVPYLAHAPMEPINCTAVVANGRCEVWAPTQAQTASRALAAKITGLPVEKVTLHTTFLGGGFGRRSQTDFVADAVHIAKAVGKPVKMIWDREDGVRGGFYRPAAYNVVRGALAADGTPIAWEHQIASPSILEQFGPLHGGVDRLAVEGAADLPYAIPNFRVTYAKPDFPITTWFWRSVGHSQNGYVTECFLDELAAAAKIDPLALRQRLLKDRPRHKRVLDLAADKAGWGGKLPAGRARGIAVHESFGSFVAEVAEVSIERKRVRVHRVVCAVDCGQVVNPDTVMAQMDSAIAYGLSAALYGDIAIKGGRAVQGNFDDYRVVRMREMPRVETHIVARGDARGGIGEPGTPPIAPAVCNAIFALTGKPVRKLPITLA